MSGYYCCGSCFLCDPIFSMDPPFQAMDKSFGGLHFQRILRPSSASPKLDPLLDENMEQWPPHLNKLAQCYKSDWIKDEKKYGDYKSIKPVPFQSQIFRRSANEAETSVANVRETKIEDTANDEIPGTSGRQFTEHLGESPLSSYERLFNWENKRLQIFGQRIPETYIPPLKISVKVLSLSFEVGLVEPFYGTICLYDKERGEKLSENFFFRVLPTEMQNGSTSDEPRGIFYLDAPSTSVCLLIQIEKVACEERSNPYCHRAQVPPTDRERQNLQAWSRVMPYKKPFAWAIFPLSSMVGFCEPTTNTSVEVEVSNLNKFKEGYTEDALQDPKRKLKEPLRGTIKFEIAKLQVARVKYGTSDFFEGKEVEETATVSPGNPDAFSADFHAFDFLTTTRNKPFLQLFHCLYIYPLSVTLSQKRNLYIHVELIKDDYSDSCTQSLQAMHSMEPHASLNEWVDTQVAVGARLALFHDEIKVSLPAIWSPVHHLMFTFYHVDLEKDIEAPKPVVIGYASLPLSTLSQLESDISLPITEELAPDYLQDSVKKKLNCLEDPKNVFKLRLRLCSSLYPVSEHIREFFLQYDRQITCPSSPWESELPNAIKSLKDVDSTVLLQFLYPILNMLLNIIAISVEKLQVPAFRSIIDIWTVVQEKSEVKGERNMFLVNYVDYVFDDGGGIQRPLYHGLSNVWRSLACSKAKGFRIVCREEDVMTRAWFFFELIVKSMALERDRLFDHDVLCGEDVPQMQVKEEVFQCIVQLYDCLLTEVHEGCKSGLSSAKHLNNSLAFFCYDLLSIIKPRQVFELVSLHLDKLSGLCDSVLHDCKLTFLQILSDHNLYLELPRQPGLDPSDRNYLLSVLIKEVFRTWGHHDALLQAKAARIFVMLLCKHKFDARYQKPEEKLYIAQLYFPLIGQILNEMTIFYNLNAVVKREVLIVILEIIHNLDDKSLETTWHQSSGHTKLFFGLLEECLTLFEHKPADSVAMVSGSPFPVIDGPMSLKYTNTLSPASNKYLSKELREDEVSHEETPRCGYLCCPYSLRLAFFGSQASRTRAPTRVVRESLDPMWRQKLELCEENLSSAVSLQVLEITDKFSRAAASRSIDIDYRELDCISAIFTTFLSRNQPLAFWETSLPIFKGVFELHGARLMASGNNCILKKISFHLFRLAASRNCTIRRIAVIGLQILVGSSFAYVTLTARLRVILTIALSEMMSDVSLTQLMPDGTLNESGEASCLKKSLEEMGDESVCSSILTECRLQLKALFATSDVLSENQFSWSDLKSISDGLLVALNAGLELSLLAPLLKKDKYAAAEIIYKLAIAFAPVPDLQIMWLLNLCEVHTNTNSMAEAAQCVLAVAGIVMQYFVSRKEVWCNYHMNTLREICPTVSNIFTSESLVATEIEGYGSSKFKVDFAIKCLFRASCLFLLARLFHFSVNVLELVVPACKIKGWNDLLYKCYACLANICALRGEPDFFRESFVDARYYRVGFYGENFEKLNGKEYVYREHHEVLLVDMKDNLNFMYTNYPLRIIQDSGQVKADELETGVDYLQITAVDPVMKNKDLGSRRERNFSLTAESSRHRHEVVNDCFVFDTPFTKNGKTQGGLEDQWRRRTILQTQGHFPGLVNRLRVIRSESFDFCPIENAIGIIEARTDALRNELEQSQYNGDLQRRLQTLETVLQGSVAVQVNSGVVGVCKAFLFGESETRASAGDLERLCSTLVEFMRVCKEAIEYHSTLIRDKDQEFHAHLVSSFRSLTAQLSQYIPDLLPQL